MDAVTVVILPRRVEARTNPGEPLSVCIVILKNDERIVGSKARTGAPGQDHGGSFYTMLAKRKTVMIRIGYAAGAFHLFRLAASISSGAPKSTIRRRCTARKARRLNATSLRGGGGNAVCSF
jgi:hypothetical protein